MGAKKEARRETSCPVTHSVHRILPLPACACLQELEDCEARFRLAAQQFAPEDALSQLSLGGPASGGAAGARRPQKATPYSLCLRSGLGGWVRGLGLSAAQLADNVEAGYQKHTPVDLQVGCGPACLPCRGACFFAVAAWQCLADAHLPSRSLPAVPPRKHARL